MCAQAAYKQPQKASEKEVADVDVRGQDEEEITEDTARHQPQQIEHRRCRGELPEQVVEHGKHQYDKAPDTEKKDRQHERNFERRQRGIEVEVLPRIGHEHLHTLVKRSTESHQ